MKNIFFYSMNIQEVFALIYKTVFCFFFLILILKLMGKREIGKISTFDVVVFFIISELFSLSLNEPFKSLWHSIIPISIIVILQILLAFISLKSRKMRNIVEGKLTYIIYKGEIDQNIMKKQRYNIDDLMTQLRNKDVQLPSEVEFAILEDSGNLNIMKKDQCILDCPEPLISDGKIVKEVIQKLNLSEDILRIRLLNYGYESEKEIFLALQTNSGLYIVPRKLSDDKKRGH